MLLSTTLAAVPLVRVIRAVASTLESSAAPAAVALEEVPRSVSVSTVGAWSLTHRQVAVAVAQSTSFKSFMVRSLGATAFT